MARPDPAVWQRLQTPQEGCLVGFGQRYVVHCGVYVDGRVVHSAKDQVVLQTLEATERWFGKATFWETV
jgi:hypothetical protein